MWTKRLVLTAGCCLVLGGAAVISACGGEEEPVPQQTVFEDGADVGSLEQAATSCPYGGLRFCPSTQNELLSTMVYPAGTSCTPCATYCKGIQSPRPWGTCQTCSKTSAATTCKCYNALCLPHSPWPGP
jgi:hypothetical protein